MNSIEFATSLKPSLSTLDKYLSVRSYTMSLIEGLSPEDMVPQPSVFASPVKWHIAHTTWFFEQMILLKYVEGYKLFDESYNYLFNSYYNSLGQRIERGQRGLITKPDVDTVLEYRTYVDHHIEELLDQVDTPELEELVVLGINHEQQHQELLLTDLKYTLSHNPIYPVYNASFNQKVNQEKKSWTIYEEDIYHIGHEGIGFSYDNEHHRHKVYLESFAISKALVTNEEYIAFMNAGGYEDAAVWLDEGWAWKNANNITKPLYWVKDGKQWKHFSLSGLKDIDMSAAVCHISHFEAYAYAMWSGHRLPTEFEWEVASSSFNWGTRWEWTNSAYLPYPRYKIVEGAVGEYNGKFMSNQMVLRGASIATSPDHSRNTYRNFFPSETRWQFSGIRIAKDI
ncbi:ergothioneine biosynthesis protein EgtB [Saprospiraceae bacterium]|nr:ergothioneine biosynthesis protein EgtB [Saprospiraceae bacterium]